MNANTAEVLSQGMECLLSHMNVVDVERFIFLLKAEGFDYTKWQRGYFGSKTKEELDSDMDRYFAANPYSSDPAKLI
ncbi:MAG: hypothetical protein K6C13_08015 [Oscillospiraceae bacterium]|nr:hypothetical protein [Oscillospiraceae bacterium]